MNQSISGIFPFRLFDRVWGPSFPYLTRAGGLSSAYLTRVGGPSSAYLTRFGGLREVKIKYIFVNFSLYMPPLDFLMTGGLILYLNLSTDKFLSKSHVPL